MERLSAIGTCEPAGLFGLFTHRKRWGLSWRGWLIGAVLVLVSGSGFLIGIHPFLAVTSRVDAQVLVMEGWLYPSGARAAADEFRQRGYNFIITTGGPFPTDRGHSGPTNTFADSGAYWLREAGLSNDVIRLAPSYVMYRDRTYHSAVALRAWLGQNAPTVKAANIVTGDVHARRTRLLFERAMGDVIKVGIIAVPNPEYDPRRWWRSSEGVREVLSETIGYLYVRFMFRVADHTASQGGILGANSASSSISSSSTGTSIHPRKGN